MARTTMSGLITTLRGMTDAGTADYTSGGTTWWTDDQIEDILDIHRTDHNHIGTTARPTYGVGGTVTWTEYWTGYINWENTPVVQNSAGSAITAGTATYSFDANRGIITFTSDQGGSAYFVTGNTYDINGAASMVWQRKASHYVTAYDVSTDNHSLKRSQLIANCLQMSSYYGMQSHSTTLNDTGSAYAERGDTTPCYG